MSNPHRGTLPHVSLVFPPLVETNFGNYFPSTATLAAYLELFGIETHQVDLNEAFALNLIQQCEFGEAGSKLDDSRSSEVFSILVDRLLRRLQMKLFDEVGRHQFKVDRAGPGHLLGLAAQRFRIDRPITELVASEFTESPIAKFYKTFYENVGAFDQVFGRHIMVLGVSVPMGPQLGPALLLCDLIKTRCPSIKTIMGGPTFSLMSDADLELILRRCRTVDAIVRFEGEEALRLLVEQACAGAWQPQIVAGVSALVGGDVLHRPPSPGLRLDDLPFAKYDTTVMSKLADPEIGIVQARGCYWGRCSYCDFVELYRGSPRYRSRSVANFVDEIEFQVDLHGDHEISIITEALPSTFASGLSREVQRRHLRPRWKSFAMVDKHFTEEVLSEMAAAGCSQLCIGMETMNDRVLKLVSKAATAGENGRFLRAACDSGIDLQVNLIPDLPTTTFSESLAVLEVLQPYRECITSVSVFPFEATRSSAIGRSPSTFGLVQVSSTLANGQAQFAANHLDVSDPAMSPYERQTAIEAYLAFADEINCLRTPKEGVALQNGCSQMRIVRDAFEFVELPGGLELYNWMTRQRVRLDSIWCEVLKTLSALPRFDRQDLIDLLGDDARSVDLVIRKLYENGLVERSQEEG